LEAVAELWLDNPDQRAQITEAAATIDQLLQFNPLEQGESRNNGGRILFAPPLVVIFRADTESRSVRVLSARQLKPRDTN
jgi:hypothetical protein